MSKKEEEEEENLYFNDSTPSASLDTNHLLNKWKSLESSYTNMPQKIWNAMSDYYVSQGPSGISELENIRKERIQKDFNQKKEDYESSMEKIYNEYYDKLSILYNLKNISNKQVEIINNTQYKILQQRDVERTMTDSITTRNRLRMYENDKFRQKNVNIQNNVYLILTITSLMVIIFALNSSELNKTGVNIVQIIVRETNKSLAFIYLLIILFITIVFQTYNLTILILILYSFLTILAS